MYLFSNLTFGNVNKYSVKCSVPHNFYEKIRLYIALRLIRIGDKLLLNNSDYEVSCTTVTGIKEN